MSDDRTMPMQKPPGSAPDGGPPAWSRRETKADGGGHPADDQETILADQEHVTPPTLPFGDQRRWPSPEPARPLDPNSVPTDPSVGAPASPYSPAQPPPRPPVPPPQSPPGSFRPRPSVPQAPGGAQAQTMIMRERPTPVFAWLVVVESPDRNAIGTVHTLHPDTTTIGRLAGNQIALNDETVSAQHARIRREVREDQEPVFALFDLGSRNGIFVGDRQTYKSEGSRVYRHELKDGDYLLLGDTTLVFKKI